MFNSFINSLLPKSFFLRWYVVVILVVNTIGCIWAVNPSAMGIYVGLFVLMPLNTIFMLLGLFIVLIMQLKKYPVSYLSHYAVVFLLPVFVTIIVIALIDLLAPHVGC